MVAAIKYVAVVGSLMALGGCVQRPCRGVELKKPLLKKEEVFADTSESQAMRERVRVYKYDGSLQCDMGKPVSPKDMQKQLGDIPVHSAKKMLDGLMHIMVCGSPTGKANVFEINKEDLGFAKDRGFEVWNF